MFAARVCVCVCVRLRLSIRWRDEAPALTTVAWATKCKSFECCMLLVHDIFSLAYMQSRKASSNTTPWLGGASHSSRGGGRDASTNAAEMKLSRRAHASFILLLKGNGICLSVISGYVHTTTSTMSTTVNNTNKNKYKPTIQQLTSLRRTTLAFPAFLQSMARHPANVGSDASSPARSSSRVRSYHHTTRG